ncbi:MAG: glycosyltransferase [Vicinamibacterales bacterium]
MKASVIVCTFNRADLLSDTLKALRLQPAPQGGYEIIVVDNNSSDDTRTVTERLAAEAGAPIRYLFEKNQGLSLARNAGIRAAHGDIIAFVDDDVDVEAGWLSAILAAFQDPLVACAGGPVRPMWPFSKPEWLTKEWEGYLGITEFESVRETGEFRWPTYPWGLNMAFRREIFDTVGYFSAELGRIGKGLLSNEEVSVCQRIDEAGHRIRFAPDAIIYHKIHADRLTRQSFYHRAYYQGRSDAILDQRSTSRAYSRVRTFASSMFWGQVQPSHDAFDTRCKERLFIGYLSQLAGMHDHAHGSYRKLRALKLFLSTILKTAAAQVSERQHHLDHLETLVHERDRWLADRDRAIADRDQQKRDIEEQLGVERDNWQRQAIESRTTIATLREELWIRVGLRLGLLNSLQSK